MEDEPDYILRNRDHWDRWAVDWVEEAERSWAQDEPTWGNWGVPESTLSLLPEQLEGRDAIELGCGSAYVSAWLARRGARPVGIDNSQSQLETARRLQLEHEIEFPLIHGNAERVPLPDASFDLAISEYGASIWCDPYRWIPEAARLLRPGGELIFLVNGILLVLCSQLEPSSVAEERLRQPLFGLHRVEWPEDESVEFSLPHGEMISLLRGSGFEVEGLTEIQVPEGSTSRHGYVSLEWSRRWPCEEVWKARKAG